MVTYGTMSKCVSVNSSIDELLRQWRIDPLHPTPHQTRKTKHIAYSYETSNKYMRKTHAMKPIFNINIFANIAHT